LHNGTMIKRNYLCREIFGGFYTLILPLGVLVVIIYSKINTM